MAALQTTEPPPQLTAAACRIKGIPRSSLFRRRASAGKSLLPAKSRPTPPRALNPAERRAVYDTLNQPRFADQAPAEVYATLLDEGDYLCSVRTMYRILAQHHETAERRRQRRHPVYQKPELLATGPNQVWSWDITKLMGPVKWTDFYRYVITDIFSRRVVGRRIEDSENAHLFKELFHDAIAKNNIPADQLTLHADRGVPMNAKTTALMLADLGVAKSHSRPHTSNDNPFSEAHFKTLKYQPEFPRRFETIDHARDFCRRFFDWYNQDHRHAGIGLMAPDQVHCGQADAFRRKPERFVRKPPAPPDKPDAVWIKQSRLGKIGQGDKWIFCLRAARVPQIRRDHG